MKRVCVIFCVLIMMGCSMFDNIKVEDINALEMRLQQLALVVSPNKDIDTATELLGNARLAIKVGNKIEAKEYEDAALIIIEMLEEK